MNSDDAERTPNYGRIAIWLGCLGSIAFVVSLASYAIFLGPRLSDKSSDWGTFGDYVSGIAGSAIGLITLIALAYTLHLQSKTLDDTKLSIRRQQFESTFFQLLTRFSQIAASVENPVEDDAPDTGQTAIRKISRHLRDAVRNEPQDDLVRAIEIAHGTVYSRYEVWLGPYFRALYHVFKLVDRSDFLTHQDKIDFSNVARAQLSRFDLALMFYNCLTSYGAKFKPLIETYGILKHLNEYDLAAEVHRTDERLYRPAAFMSQEERERLQ